MKLAGRLLGDTSMSLADVSPEGVQAACEAFAAVAPRSRDTEAAEALAWMAALSLVQKASQSGGGAEARLTAELEEARRALAAERTRNDELQASLLSGRRLARRLEAELRREHERADRMERRTDMPARPEVRPAEDAASPLVPVAARLLVVGGSSALASRLAPWMPNAQFVGEDESGLLDVAAVRGRQAVVVLTSHISHALAETVSDEARRQGIPLILVGWSNSARIVRAVQQALDRED
jgi:hypothetical protein